MAKSISIFKVRGTIDDVTFRRTEDGNIASFKSRLDKDRVLTDPKFARTRENMEEFKFCAITGKKLRNAMNVFLANFALRFVVGQMMKVLFKCLKLDTTNPRGERKPYVGLQTPQGKAILKRLSFSKTARLDYVLKKHVTVDSVTGAIYVGSITPINDLSYPVDSTHVKFSGGLLGINLQTDASDLQLAPDVWLEIDDATSDVTLTPAELPSVTTLKLYILKVEFYQQINGVNYLLKDNKHITMSFVSVE